MLLVHVQTDCSQVCWWFLENNWLLCCGYNFRKISRSSRFLKFNLFNLQIRSKKAKSRHLLFQWVKSPVLGTRAYQPLIHYSLLHLLQGIHYKHPNRLSWRFRIRPIANYPVLYHHEWCADNALLQKKTNKNWNIFGTITSYLFWYGIFFFDCLHTLCLWQQCAFWYLIMSSNCGNLQYSSPKSESRKTDQARSSDNGFDVGTLSTSPNCKSSNTKYNESSSGSSRTSINFTTFGWSN